MMMLTLFVWSVIGGSGQDMKTNKSTYKFKRAFFRHDCRTTPKFGTHVRIETRLAHQKKFTNPTPEGFRGLFIDVGLFVGGMWHDSSRW